MRESGQSFTAREETDMKTYTFNVFNNYAAEGVCRALKDYNRENAAPIVVCVGSDLVVGDSLGPLVGTFLRQKNAGAYIYGTLNQPITSKEVEYVKRYLKQLHPKSMIIAVDAAVGETDDVGLIKTADKGLKPGLGVDKNLSEIGDVSIVGVVAVKSYKNYRLFNLTRLSLIYRMAEAISQGIADYAAFYREENAPRQNAI